MRTQTKRNVIGLSIVAVIVVIVAGLLYAVKSNALEREIAAWEAAGLPLDPAELMPPAPPDDENAAVAYLRLVRGLSGLPDWSDEGTAAYTRMYLDPSPDGPVLDHRAPQIRLAEHFAEQLDILHERLQPGHAWRWPESALVEGPASTPETRMAQQLLMIEVRAHAAAGDLVGMARSCESLARLADRAGELPTTFGFLAQANVDRRLLRLLEERAPADLSLIGLEEQLRERDYRSVAIECLVGEAAAILHWRRHMPENTGSGRAGTLVNLWQADDLAYYLAKTREAIERFEPDYCEQDDPNWQPDVDERDTYSEMMLSGLSNYNVVVAETEALRRMALFAFELRRKRDVLGSYGAALAETEVPVSPTTGEAFEVVVDETSLLIRTDRPRGDKPLEWRWE